VRGGGTAREVRAGLGFWDRLVLFVAWLVTCGLVYLFGFYVGKGTNERGLAFEDRAVSLRSPQAPPGRRGREDHLYETCAGSRGRGPPRVPGQARPEPGRRGLAGGTAGRPDPAEPSAGATPGRRDPLPAAWPPAPAASTGHGAAPAVIPAGREAPPPWRRCLCARRGGAGSATRLRMRGGALQRQTREWAGDAGAIAATARPALAPDRLLRTAGEPTMRDCASARA
jgi:hypothetical protein